MDSKRLNHKLECKACGTILMAIPDNPDDDTPVRCSNCGGYLGQWGELRDDFYKQARGAQAFDLNQGNIIKK
ncbi:hypothetical protein NKH10_27455 [Mesorhizobium sp. M1340]|uniref:hypothetical protein n=1 Tax=unclassified Mesorhizobium TaxID=325217 RepID=UPI00333A9586